MSFADLGLRYLHLEAMLVYWVLALVVRSQSQSSSLKAGVVQFTLRRSCNGDRCEPDDMYCTRSHSGIYTNIPSDALSFPMHTTLLEAKECASPVFDVYIDIDSAFSGYLTP